MSHLHFLPRSSYFGGLYYESHRREGTERNIYFFLKSFKNKYFCPKGHILLGETRSVTWRILNFTAMALLLGMFPLGLGVQKLYEIVNPKSPTQLLSTYFPVR